jgi:hypothetical protein
MHRFGEGKVLERVEETQWYKVEESEGTRVEKITKSHR